MDESIRIYEHPGGLGIYLQEMDGCFYSLHARQRIIGRAAWRLSDHNEASLIDIIITAVEYRDMGIGSWMLNVICSAAWRTGAKSIQGTMYPDRMKLEDLESFYKRNGFEVRGLKVIKQLNEESHVS